MNRLVSGSSTFDVDSVGARPSRAFGTGPARNSSRPRVTLSMIGFKLLSDVGSSENRRFRKLPCSLGVDPASSVAFALSREISSLVNFVGAFCLSERICLDDLVDRLGDLVLGRGLKILVAGQLVELILEELLGQRLEPPGVGQLGLLVLLDPIRVIRLDLVADSHGGRVHELTKPPGERVRRE